MGFKHCSCPDLCFGRARCGAAFHQQSRTFGTGEWTVYPGSYNSQRHSPLKQITPANAHLLQ
jgi:glucose dehydrogenase